jgi:hypothetical protein
MAAKTAFVLEGSNIRVSEDWRTRARTWDPLIKSRTASVVFARQFCKPSQNPSIKINGLQREYKPHCQHLTISAH